MSARRLILVTLASLGALAGALCAWSAPALATEGHAFSTLFTGSGAQALSEPTDVAVNDETGDVYVVDKGHDRIEEFSSEGAVIGEITGAETPAKSFSSPEWIAIDDSGKPLTDPSAGDVYVADNGHKVIDKFTSTGTYLGQITAGVGGHQFEEGIDGIAVDPEGLLWAIQPDREIDDYSNAQPNAFLASREDPYNPTPGAFAVTSEDDLYVKSGGEYGGFDELNSGGGVINAGGPYGPATVTGIAVESPTSDVYVDTGASIELWSGAREILSHSVESFGFEHLIAGAGLAINLSSGNAASGTVYVADRAGDDVAVFPEATLQVVTGQATNTLKEPGYVTLSGTVNPGGLPLTSCEFEYVPSSEYTPKASNPYAAGGSVPCTPGASEIPSGAIPAGPGPVAVHANLAGLKPDTTYHFRLIAANKHFAIPGKDATFASTALPQVAESVESVTSSSATFGVVVNPGGADATYRVEYGPSAEYGYSAPVPEEDVGSGTSPISLSTLVEGLAPGATYHYRVVAHNALGVTAGPDGTFTTQGTSTEVVLPDARAWEMVSPPAKQGTKLEAFGIGRGSEDGLIQAAEGGGALTYIAKAPIETDAPGDRSIAYTSLLARRGAGGWSTQNITTPTESVAGVNILDEYRFFSSDLSTGVVESESGTPLSSATSEWSPYLREADGEYVPLVSGCPPPSEPCPADVREHADVPPGTKFGPEVGPGADYAYTARLQFVDATPDLSHVVLSSPTPLKEGFETDGVEALYEWQGGTLQPVSVLPNEASAGTEGGASVGNGENVRNAVSADSERIFFETRRPSEDHLYMRDMADGKTVQLDVPENGAKGGLSQANFQEASSDGSKAFFTDTAQLTVDATSTEGQPDLYMCEVGEAAGRPTCKLKDLTVDHNSGESANVAGTLVGAGEDGTYVYFLAEGALAEGAVARQPNLYVYDTATGKTTLIATVSQTDADHMGVSLSELTARVSPNGRYLAFMSERSLTGYDNHDAVSGEPDQEVYEYDAVSGRLVCASCDPTGARPAGVFDHNESEYNYASGEYEIFPALLVDKVGIWMEHWLAGSILPYTSTRNGAYYQPRYLDDSGRLFFDSPVGLVPQDANGKEDVYEFEPQSVGGCRSSTSTGTQVYVGEVAGSPVEGCVGLISSGTSSEESAFLDATGMGPGGEEGEEAFFMTESQLAPQDVDNAFDVYDAHSCSAASPCPPTAVAVPPACTTAESCRVASPPQPAIFGAPSSETFSGAGNVSPAASEPVVEKTTRCVKGRRLSHGKCVKAKKKKPKKARKAGRDRRAR